MLAFQGHAGFGGVIETLALQADEGEFFAVVVRMASRAVRLAGRTLIFVRMKTGVGVKPALDLGMTFEALKTARSPAGPEVVTGGALCYAFILLMGVCQRAG